MSFGVTYDRSLEKKSGPANLGVQTTWIFSKKQEMPVFFFGGKRLNPPDVAGVREGDAIGVYADPEARLVEFYCNAKMVGSSESLEVPLPPSEGRPLCVVEYYTLILFRVLGSYFGY